MPAALNIIRALRPNLSTVKAEMMPPRMIQAWDAAARAPASAPGKPKLDS